MSKTVLNDFTAKARARDLVLTYLPMFKDDYGDSHETALFQAKKAARYCVDVVLEIQNFYDERGEEVRYWKKVYNEIEFVR